MRYAESFTRRRLPHWDVPDAAYFITTCLDGSIPAEGLLDLGGYRAELEQRPRPKNIDEAEWRRTIWKLAFARMDSWLDDKPAVRHLADPKLAEAVVESMYWGAGERYDLLAFVVMPSHVHWVFQPRADWIATLPESSRQPRQRIQHGMNRHTAVVCNALRGATGQFWQHESYDHWVRDVDELERILRYIEANPVKAGLVTAPEEWRYSSAHDRKRAGKEFGQPLVKADRRP